MNVLRRISSLFSKLSDCRIQRIRFSFIDLSRLDLRQENDLFDCADILASLLKWAIVELFAEPARKAEISASFQNKIAILRRGMDTKQEETGC